MKLDDEMRSLTRDLGYGIPVEASERVTRVVSKAHEAGLFFTISLDATVTIRRLAPGEGVHRHIVNPLHMEAKFDEVGQSLSGIIESFYFARLE